MQPFVASYINVERLGNSHNIMLNSTRQSNVTRNRIFIEFCFLFKENIVFSSNDSFNF